MTKWAAVRDQQLTLLNWIDEKDADVAGGKDQVNLADEDDVAEHIKKLKVRERNMFVCTYDTSCSTSSSLGIGCCYPCLYSLGLLRYVYYTCLTTLIFISLTQSVHHVFSILCLCLYFRTSLTSSPSSLLITCPYHLNLASLTFSAMSTTPHLLISSFHNVSDQLSFISSYYMSIPSQPCFSHLLCNVYHPTSSYLFIP